MLIHVPISPLHPKSSLTQLRGSGENSHLWICWWTNNKKEGIQGKNWPVCNNHAYIRNDYNCDFLELYLYVFEGSRCPLVGSNKWRWLEAPPWTGFFHQRHVRLQSYNVSQDLIYQVIIQPPAHVISEGRMSWDRTILNTFSLENIYHWLVLKQLWHIHEWSIVDLWLLKYHAWVSQSELDILNLLVRICVNLFISNP